MAGLLQGNPYYSGPSPMAAGVNAFADNFMKGTEFFNKMDQDKIQTQIMQQKLAEYQNEQKMRDELSAYQAQGLMAPAGGPQQPMPQMNDFGGGMGASAMGQPMAQPGMGAPMGGPPIQADPSIQGIPEAAPAQRPELESLKGMLDIVSKYNPEKGIALKAQLQSATSKAELNQALLDFKVAAQDAKNGYMSSLMDLKGKMADDAVARATETARHNKETELIAATRANKTTGDSGRDKASEKKIDQYNSIIAKGEANIAKELVPSRKKALEASLAPYVTARDQLIGISNVPAPAAPKMNSVNQSQQAPAAKKSMFSSLWGG